MGVFGQRIGCGARSLFTMTKNIALSRPAMSAIAAFLVLSIPAAFAQEAPAITMTPPVASPTPQTPPTVPEPATTAPVAAPQTAQPRTTQPQAPKPVIRLPLEIEPDNAAPASKTAGRAEPARTERGAPRARVAAATAATEAPEASAPIAEPSPDESFTTIPPPAPAMTTADPVVDATPAPVEPARSTGNDFPWEIAGGAAALLIVAGAGVALARRRRVGRDDSEAGHEPVAIVEPKPAGSVASGGSARASEAPQWVTPAYAPQESIERPSPATPAFAAAPGGSIGRHEAMALAGPTPENPFATLSKRLKRARFLDRQERAAYDETLGAQKDMTRKPVSAWEIAQRDVAPAHAEQEVRRPGRGPARPGTLRPGFTRN